ncbi:hypothetical protein E2I00_001544 [Balaenoptera physalus]|uniref:Uncharacterized protein n=1 Tax=Balaenoptera physalus TaxID=9770 RepID=A0A6A1QDG7_BALPH|nr:hypothetical protein E2I00_001544 [Balaenoptera physalus]
MNLPRAERLRSTPPRSLRGSDREDAAPAGAAEGAARRGRGRPCALLHPHPLRYLLLSAPAVGSVAEAPRKAQGADLGTPGALPALLPTLGSQPWEEGKGPASRPAGGCTSFSIESILQGVRGAGTGAAQSLPPTPWGYCHLLQRPSCLLHPQAAAPLLHRLRSQQGRSAGPAPVRHRGAPGVSAWSRGLQADVAGRPFGRRGDLTGLLNSTHTCLTPWGGQGANLEGGAARGHALLAACPGALHLSQPGPRVSSFRGCSGKFPSPTLGSRHSRASDSIALRCTCSLRPQGKHHRLTTVRAPGAAADEPRADPEALPRALQETSFTSFPWPQARPAEPRTWVTAGRIPAQAGP